MKILDAYPIQAATRPGNNVTLRLELLSDEAINIRLSAQLLDRNLLVTQAQTTALLQPGNNQLDIQLKTPEVDGRGYQAAITITTRDGSSLRAYTAVLVVSHWRLAPRYGFLSDFPPKDNLQERIAELAKFHITVVQFYDWMYRHYRFLPPEDEFVDAMKRRLSLNTVRARVQGCHELGMAALAYGAIYGAEPEFAREHPDWVLRDAVGKPLALIDLFFITDIRPTCGWREHILQEYETAVRELGFDGIHMDQYGFPKRAVDARGEAVDFANDLPGLISEAASRVAKVRQGAAVLFNAVNNWPIQHVAKADQAAVYIEVWPPHDSYGDLVDLIRRARDLSNKQVILAAYLEPYREGGVGAEQAALFVTAVIASAGGHHLLLGEGHAVLRDPYYPNHGQLATGFIPQLRRYYDHTAAYHHYLFDLALEDVTTSYSMGINQEIVLRGVRSSPYPEAGAVWLNIKRRDNQFVINLVNLVGVTEATWNTHKEPPQVLSNLSLYLSSFAKVTQATWTSPDQEVQALDLTITMLEDDRARLELPDLVLWATLIVDVH